MLLTDRQLLILQVIVDDFIRSAQPVGSRSLSKKEEISFSSATIRNEMADLEELGFIEKTHTSSGRVPSEKGYRYYVDHLVSPQALNQNDISIIQSIFAERIFEFEAIIQKSANILSFNSSSGTPDKRSFRMFTVFSISLASTISGSENVLFST